MAGALPLAYGLTPKGTIHIQRILVTRTSCCVTIQPWRYPANSHQSVLSPRSSCQLKMKTPSDLAPTEPLRGLHMIGTVTRRFLVTYPVPPAALASAVPPCGELVLHNGLAWVSACFVHIARMRPSLVPEPLGIGFNYLIHRTLARLPYPDGKMRNSVLVLEAISIANSLVWPLER